MNDGLSKLDRFPHVTSSLVKTMDGRVIDIGGMVMHYGREQTALMEYPQPPTLKVKLLNEHAVAPERGSVGAIGYDLFASDNTIIPMGAYGMVPTGIAVAIPEGHYGRVAPRSGLAAKNGIDVLAGVIDADYRGEVKVILINHGREPLRVERGQRIAQLILERASVFPVKLCAELDDTQRGESGFGSTGV
jgi:dUTP pyrophosphatase